MNLLRFLISLYSTYFQVLLSVHTLAKHVWGVEHRTLMSEYYIKIVKIWVFLVLEKLSPRAKKWQMEDIFSFIWELIPMFKVTCCWIGPWTMYMVLRGPYIDLSTLCPPPSPRPVQEPQRPPLVRLKKFGNCWSFLPPLNYSTNFRPLWLAGHLNAFTLMPRQNK